jgi:hypothetical protein
VRTLPTRLQPHIVQPACPSLPCRNFPFPLTMSPSLVMHDTCASSFRPIKPRILEKDMAPRRSDADLQDRAISCCQFLTYQRDTQRPPEQSHHQFRYLQSTKGPCGKCVQTKTSGIVVLSCLYYRPACFPHIGTPPASCNNFLFVTQDISHREQRVFHGRPRNGNLSKSLLFTITNSILLTGQKKHFTRSSSTTSAG